MTDFTGARRAGDEPALRELGLAITSNVRGEYDTARKHARQAAAEFSQRGNQAGRMRAMFEVVYANLKLTKAKGCLSDTQVLESEVLSTRYRWLRTQLALEHAVCLYQQRRMSAAQQQLERALQLAEASNFHTLRLRAYTFDAGIQADTDCNQTWQRAYAGLGIYWSGPRLAERKYELISPIKQCFEKKHFWAAAEALERRMLNILHEEVDPEDRKVLLQVTAHQSLAQILRELGEQEAAEDEFNMALKLLSPTLDQKAVHTYLIPINLQQAELQLEQGDLEASSATIQEVEPYIKESDKHFELNFLRLSAEIKSAKQQWSQAEEDYKRALEIAESPLNEYPTEERRQLWINEVGEVYRGMVALLHGQGKDEEAVRLLGWYRNRASARAPGPAAGHGTVRWKAIEGAILAQSLPSNSGVRLMYVSTRTSLFIFIIRNTGVESITVPETRSDLQRKVHQYVHLCSIPLVPGSALPVPEAEGKALFNVLLQPVMGRLRGSETVIAEVDPVMNGLPLEALVSPGGRFFGEIHPLVYSPGYIRERNLRQPAQGAPVRGLALNALDGSLKIGYQDQLQESYSAMEFRDGSDTAAEDLPALLKSKEIFAYFGHARKGKLYLTSKTTLASQDFPPKSLASLQVAILAACSSATGQGSRWNLNTEDDVRSLVHAFQSGGTPQVLASHWDVNEQTTVELVSSFLRYLSQGKAPPDALYEARKKMIKTNRHPYFWASFVIYGTI